MLKPQLQLRSECPRRIERERGVGRSIGQAKKVHAFSVEEVRYEADQLHVVIGRPPQGAQIHLAPTWDKSDQWIASMRHIAREGRVFVIAVCQALHRDQVPDRYAFKPALPAGLEWINVGNSMIVDPEGVVLAGPVAEREEILLAEIDPGRTSGSRWIFDAAGHYNRPDMFRLEVRGGSREAAATRAAAPRRRPAGSRNGSKNGAARKSAARRKPTRKSMR